MAFGPSHLGKHFALAMALAVLAMFDRPVLVAEAARGALPSKLSQLGLFTDLRTLTPIASGLSYEVNFPLWSDGATKRRWVFLPAGSRISLPAEDVPDATWNLPVGTYLIKQFDFERRVETRVSHLTPVGWEMASYLWDENQEEARRVDLSQSVLVRTPLQSDPPRARTGFVELSPFLLEDLVARKAILASLVCGETRNADRLIRKNAGRVH